MKSNELYTLKYDIKRALQAVDIEDSTNSQSQETGNDSPGATYATSKKNFQL